ncbi:MAG: hypothetical protein mread185_000119 [Mycoplasmataceae bacterium]|nr:MAG: hypothetical protein mread185_000119 [Mycoplasmataceae bacterium]
MLTKSFKCFRCQKQFEVEIIEDEWYYAHKNDWYFWSSNPEEVGKIQCDQCLINLYRHKIVFRLLVPDREKQKLLGQYIKEGRISE